MSFLERLKLKKECTLPLLLVPIIVTIIAVLNTSNKFNIFSLSNYKDNKNRNKQQNSIMISKKMLRQNYNVREKCYT